MARPVFWDVDTQRDFMEPGGALYVPGAEHIVSNLRRLTDHARRQGITVVASVCDHSGTDDEISATPDFHRTFPPHCLHGTRGQEKISATSCRDPVLIEHRAYTADELHALVPPRGGAIVITKHALDVFTNPATATLLRVLDPDPVVVYGVAMDFCVDLTAMGLARRGRRVTCIEDAMRAVDRAAGVRCAARWRAAGVEITTTDAILARGPLDGSR
jgi:nicotinamidase/pyrazinamidase